MRQNVTQVLAAEGLVLESLKTTATSAEVRLRNPRFGQTAQALGRAARALTVALPHSVETITIVPVVNGIPTTATTFARSDLEELEYAPDGSWQSFVRATTVDAADLAPTPVTPGIFPKFSWGLSPYFEPQFFDPNNPALADIGAKLTASWEPAPGLIFSGELRQKVVGNLNKSRDANRFVLPPTAPPKVRSEGFRYNQFSDLTVRHLTAEYFFRPGANLYGRVTAGYLEQMYGGVSTEVLWKEPGRRLSLGLEVNYARQREFKQRFGFQNYDVITGHASAYYDFGEGFHGQLDVGRYLAGDWGATVTLDREFDNGWKVGAFATKTTVSSAEFGEGSFDKGIRLTIPLDWVTGKPSRRTQDVTLRPVQRDGGAKLEVRNRLYDKVRGDSAPDLAASWGRFWR